MKPYVAVFIGGTLGSLFRYAVNMSVGGAFFPWPTFIENASGSLLLGLLTGFFSSRAKHKLIQLMLGTGFCGGYTTMSAFSKETALILHSSSPHIGVLYLAASFVSGLCLAFIGIVFGTRIGRNKERYES
ncbi:fluoride efflux transporter FluC [Bacillus glycinifermentans]|uniref:Fluoride-specific ion channel FluC n=1 Tax=Bacillus glycinifermentans TaxID=1664069 RepID=A0A0T6BSS2_9BACI|nr:CrcB family protein [Bacillus glycinifermentans]ATH94892.1 CrcB family protein [Bacillus glycinifermentans]KRT94522.1 chromosome condensation protein CrcB [Bacillus glycinifermentans]MEC0486762.1 CrcB family protein [Bacillus glycinifermentans]MEC3606426.1 CrcB family protein [Bacillus glycinifermentans]UOY88380.1 CrcB family protein [Bacillus glycinifermentans]